MTTTPGTSGELSGVPGVPGELSAVSRVPGEMSAAPSPGMINGAVGAGAGVTVGVVVPTCGRRPTLLRAALASVLGQDWPGPLDVVVVVDGGTHLAAAHAEAVGERQVEPRGEAEALRRGGARGAAGVWGPVGMWGETAGGSLRETAGGSRGEAAGGSLGEGVGRVAEQVADVVAGGCPPGRGAVRVVANRFRPGLPGARNTGIAALTTDFVAFCDDDDAWLPGKLTAQLAALSARPGAEFASCAITVEYRSRSVTRLAGKDVITSTDLSRSRMVMVHSSTFLFRRGALWADETAPNGQNEDWDLALRAAKRHPIAHVDRPLVRVRWGASDYVTRWGDRIAGLEWMLARHTELAVDPRGAARIYGQLAFHHAALGRRREAVRWAARACAARPAEPRAPLALAVAAGLLSAQGVLSLLHTRGHGI
ncbi:hypothetical protein Misp01_24240 [Microtetraspora sp. NBRC 13810]|uniref:glycosyltransferase family 2 protein n=1 Tax=Microtetraspora sp. NBRC 13810 TaxID=3030990 RepID=UPI0024A02A3A|nr:glycosyltransferase family 2 protein [Microtetraspora sp. NBRC 13810]GLW07294.1 hypothetical protein Misp01_24240 [Microtetraspora sp. NBRC 13810]